MRKLDPVGLVVTAAEPIRIKLKRKVVIPIFCVNLAPKLHHVDI
jgi:hypothetical protein